MIHRPQTSQDAEELRRSHAQARDGGSAPPSHRWLWVAAFVGWWTAFGLMFAARDRFWTMARGREPLIWIDALKFGLLQSWLIAVLALAAFWVARTFPLEGRSWVRNMVVHVGVGAAVILFNVLLMHGVYTLVQQDYDREIPHLLLAVFPAWTLMYTTTLGIGFGIQYFQRYRNHQLRASRLESQLAQARLQALNMQLHPHFLFNTLNSISTLMHRDVYAADRMLSRLEDLLRLTLAKSGAQEVPLRDELALLEPYMEIEQTRFGTRLSVEWEVEAEALDASVPQLILQPLVENAIKHGIAPRSAPGRIRIAAQRVGEMLELEVSDNGPGISDHSPRRGQGVGLSNTRARLKQLYPSQHRLEIGNAMEGGACIRIYLPFRTTGVQAPAAKAAPPLAHTA
jgi:two-component system, LytTR family, sensor kinase